MSILVTGATGYLGSYVVQELLERTDDRLALLVRGANEEAHTQKLWRALQLHMGPDAFYRSLDRIDWVVGDLHAPGLGIDPEVRAHTVRNADSVIHIAASLNRKSAKSCLNTNLRGTLSVIKLAREMADNGGLRRFSHVSTVAVSGHRNREVVDEDDAIDWGRSDYDPYGRTKKFCEHMVCELLPDVSRVFLRPSIVLGDSRRAETTQFDMVRAFCGLADLPVVPLDPNWRVDIVNADFVGEAVARLHLKEQPAYERYHLSSGIHSPTIGQVAEAMNVSGKRMRFTPRLAPQFGWTMRALNRLPRRNPMQPVGALMKVFWPYITYDTVFANHRVCTEMERQPEFFPNYCGALYEFATSVNHQYPYRTLPARNREAA